MATIYSGYMATSSSTRTRVRVDYDGTKASATLLFTNNDNSSVSTQDGQFTFAGQSATINKSFDGNASDETVATVWFDISLAGGAYEGETVGNSSSLFDWRGSVVIPAQGSATQSQTIPMALNSRAADATDDLPIAATRSQWQDLASRVKAAEESAFTDEEWNGMWG